MGNLLIGALELGDYLERQGDDVLEATVIATNSGTAGTFNPRQLTCVSDAVLETAGASMVAPSWPNGLTQCPTIGCGPTQAICRL